MKALSTIPLLIMLALLAACDTTGPEKEPEEPEPFFPAAINEDIDLLFTGLNHLTAGSLFLSEWQPGQVFTIGELHRLDVQDNVGFFSVSNTVHYDEADPVDGDGRPLTYITKNPIKSLLYFVVTNKPGRSIGELRVFNLETRKPAQLLRDSTYHISSIRIREKPDGSLLKVYYSYGNPETGLQAGYYRLKEGGPPDELLLAHSNPNGPDETINGFDVSPDGTTLLYPIHHAFVPGSAYGGPPPELATLNLETGETNTLPVAFNLQQFLWARYHPSGDSLVVGNYPRKVLGFNSVDVDSIYTVDLSDYSRRALDTRTNFHYHSSDLFPSWSPDGDYLLYNSAQVFAQDLGIGGFSLYIMDMRN